MEHNRKPGMMRPQHSYPWWFCYTFQNPLRRIIHNPDTLLRHYVHAGDIVLDVGPGIGYFTLALARVTGESGRVIAADIQPKLLNVLMRRAARAGVADRITPRLSTPARTGVTETVDFALAFWVVHEIPDQHAFFLQVRDILSPSGGLLVAEPKLHVSRGRFARSLAIAEKAGFYLYSRPTVRMSHCALLRTAAQAA